MRAEAIPVRDAAGLRGYLAAHGEQCEAILPTGRTLGYYNTVCAAVDALRQARTDRTENTETSDI